MARSYPHDGMILTHANTELRDALWIDLLDPTDEESARVTKATGLRVPTKAQISEIESSSRLGFEDGAFYLSTPIAALHGEGELELSPVGFVLSSRVLLTIRYAELPAFQAAHEACDARHVQSAEEAALRIFEVVVDRAADKLERAGAECDTLSRVAFRGHRRDPNGARLQATLQKIGNVAEWTSRIRDSLTGIGRIAAYVVDSGIEGAPALSAARVKPIRADVASLLDYEAHLAGKVQFLLDATLGFINIQQNDIVKTLTIASVVGIPPVLIVGVYGMNFKFMPELEWHLGYPFALALIVTSALVPLVWFKRRGWMG